MSLRVFLPPQRLQRRNFINQQCRQISLLYATRAVTTLGGHEIASFTPYKFPETKNYKVNIWQRKPVKHRGNWSVQKALLELHEPGTLLRPLNLIDGPKSDRRTERLINIPANFVPADPAHALGDDPNYMFKKIRINKVKIARSKLGTAAKSIHFSETSVNTSYFEHMMGKASWFLQNHRKVEISIHAKTAERLEKLIGSCPHIHPEAILNAMPEKCSIIIDPQINMSRHVIAWAIGPPDEETQSLMPKLMNFKMRVLRDIDLGIRPEPKVERRYWQRMAKLAQMEQEEHEAKSKLEGESKDDEHADDEHTDKRHTNVEHIDDGHIHDVEVRDETTNPTSKTSFTPITLERDGSKSK